MTQEDADFDDLFDEANIVSSYSIDDAIADGVLIHPYPNRWPWLIISATISAGCEQTEADKRTYDQKLMPLLVDCIMKAQADQFKTDSMLVLESTVVGTVWITRNEKGGMTVITPEDY